MTKIPTLSPVTHLNGWDGDITTTWMRGEHVADSRIFQTMDNKKNTIS